MCTAHNHSKYCNCGFGEGKNNFHNYNYEVNYSQLVLEIYPTSIFSYTNPNARCPVCDEPVYFYQNSYGSRVFFDELGPPWPKHPCTDNSFYSYNKKYNNVNKHSIELNFIPKEFNDNIDSNEKKTFWRPFNRKDFEHLYDSIYKFKENEYYKLNSLIGDIIFINDSNIDEIVLSGYDIDNDLIQECRLFSKKKCSGTSFELNFKASENDIFFVRITKDILFSTFVKTTNRIEEDFEMKINQFSDKTRKRILFGEINKINTIKVCLKKGKLYEV